jgi:hypothetical protein
MTMLSHHTNDTDGWKAANVMVRMEEKLRMGEMSEEKCDRVVMGKKKN